MLNTSSTVAELIDQVYETLERPEQWSIVLNRICTYFDIQELTPSSIPPSFWQDDSSIALIDQSNNKRLLESSSSNEEKGIQLLVTHIRRAVHLKQMLIERTQQAETGIRMLDAVRTGVLIMQANGEIVHVNPAARGMLKTNSALSIRTNRIWSPNTQKYQQLKTAINKMIALENTSLSGLADSHLVIQHEKDVVYVHLSLASNQAHKMSWMKQPPKEQVIVILQMTDFKQGLSIKTRQQLLSVYQLSKAEMNIAGLVADGLQVNEIAELLQLSANTIRTQFKAIYKKTNTRRQSELMQLLFRFD